LSRAGHLDLARLCDHQGGGTGAATQLVREVHFFGRGAQIQIGLDGVHPPFFGDALLGEDVGRHSAHPQLAISVKSGCTCGCSHARHEPCKMRVTRPKDCCPEGEGCEIAAHETEPVALHSLILPARRSAVEPAQDQHDCGQPEADALEVGHAADRSGVRASAGSFDRSAGKGLPSDCATSRIWASLEDGIPDNRQLWTVETGALISLATAEVPPR
jgi:hypothetical protein